jgi:hypothetical protein
MRIRDVIAEAFGAFSIFATSYGLLVLGYGVGLQ